jgi:hypothetical protein
VELALVMRELWAHKRLLAVGVVISAACAVVAVCRVQLLPPKLTPRALQYSSGSIQAFVDSPNSFVNNITPPLGPLAERATVFGNLMVSPGALDLIGQDSGIPGDQIWAAGPIDPSQQREVIEPTATKRSYQVAGEALPYRIEFLADPNLPIISIYTQAPTSTQAIALANGSVTALSHYIETLQTQNQVPPRARVTVRTIGRASAAPVNGGITKKLAALVFLATFVAWCVLVLIGLRFRENWRRTAPLTRARTLSSGPDGFSTALPGQGAGFDARGTESSTSSGGWPARGRTSRASMRSQSR